ncbi:hypothetical protein JCM10295v2_003685 [Rhodotorula toruloides]
MSSRVQRAPLPATSIWAAEYTGPRPDNPRAAADAEYARAERGITARARPARLRILKKTAQLARRKMKGEADVEDADELGSDSELSELDEEGSEEEKEEDQASKKAKQSRKHLDLNTDIGLMSTADADAEERRHSAAEAARKGLQNRDPSTAEGRVLRMESIREVDQAFAARSRSRPLFTASPDITLSCFVSSNVSVAGAPQLHLGQPSLSPRLFTTEVTVANLFPNIGVQAAVAVGLIAQTATSETEALAIAADPAVAARFSPANANSKVDKTVRAAMRDEIRAWRTAHPQSGSDPYLLDKYAVLLMDALLVDRGIGGNIKVGKNGVPVASASFMFDRVFWPTIARVLRMVTTLLCPGGTNVPATVGRRGPASYRASDNVTCGPVYPTLNNEIQKNEPIRYWILHMPTGAGIRKSKQFHLPAHTPEPPIPASGRIWIAKQDRSQPLDAQLRAAYPLMTTEWRAEMGLEISRVDPASVDRANKGLVAFLRARLTPEGRLGGEYKASPRAWTLAPIRPGHAVCHIHRGALVCNQPGGGGPEKGKNKVVLTVRDEQVARGAIAVGTDHFLRTKNFKDAETLMARFVAEHDKHGYKEAFVNLMLRATTFREGDEVFTCESCITQTDASELTHAQPRAGFPTDWNICGVCRLAINADRYLSPFYALSTCLKVEQQGLNEDDAKLSRMTKEELEKEYIKANPDIVDGSTGLADDAYLKQPVRVGFVTTRSSVGDQLRFPLATLDCVGAMPPAEGNNFVKHAELRNIVPTSAALNMALQQEPKWIAGLLAVSSALNTAAAVLEEQAALDPDSKEKAIAIIRTAVTKIDEAKSAIIAAAHRFSVVYTKSPLQIAYTDVLGSDSPFTQFLARVSIVDDVAKKFTRNVYSTAPLPGTLEWYTATFEHLRNAFFDDFDHVKQNIVETATPAPPTFRLPQYLPEHLAGLDDPQDKSYILCMIEELRQAYNPSFVFAKLKGGEPCFLHADEAAQVEQAIGRRLDWDDMVREARLRYYRMLEECDVNYWQDQRFNPREAFPSFVVELYLELILGEGEDLFGGPVYFLAPNHAFSGGIGHLHQRQAMRMGMLRARPTSVDDYNLEVRNIRRRRWSTRCFTVIMQLFDDDDPAREETLKEMISAARDLLNTGALPVLGDELEASLIEILDELPPDYDVLCLFRQRKYIT